MENRDENKDLPSKGRAAFNLAQIKRRGLIKFGGDGGLLVGSHSPDLFAIRTFDTSPGSIGIYPVSCQEQYPSGRHLAARIFSFSIFDSQLLNWIYFGRAL